MNEDKIKVLDCTLRDGGYYCNWDFDRELVEQYFKSIEKSNVDIIEVGLRSTKKNKFFGPFAYCTDVFLNSLEIGRDVQVAVMINASEFIKDEKANIELLNKYFDSKLDSRVDLVRIASHFNEVDKLGDIVKILSDKGYSVGLNLMQIGGKSRDEIVEAAKKAQSYDCIDVLYFADSLGNMSPRHICDVIETLKSVWKKELGIHAHNNKGHAISNTLEAFNQGATWLDCTVTGMGRGAGNSQTDYLLFEINNLTDNKKYNPEALFKLVLEKFDPLKEKCGWGSSLMYYLSAQYNIHPTFIQELLNNENSQSDLLIDTINRLKTKNTTSFNSGHLNEAMKYPFNDSTGDWSPKSLIDGKEVLIIGSGPGIKKHIEGIKNYIKRSSPIVLCLNHNEYFPSELVDAYVACHPTRLLMNLNRYTNLEKPLIAPKGSLATEISSKLKSKSVFNYGLFIKDGKFDVSEKECTIPWPYVFAYALGVSTAGDANRILLAGFDGYGVTNSKQEEMERILQLYKGCERAKDLISITPTTYKVLQSTVYSPDL